MDAVKCFDEAIWLLDHGCITIGDFEEIIKPLRDVEPVRRGKWVQISPARIYECSVCGGNVMTEDIDVYRWCHQCGARMDGDLQ